jgi:replicative DNA helicase
MVGGPYAIAQIMHAVGSANNIEAHSMIILQKFIQREVIRVAGEAIGAAYEDGTDCFDLVDDLSAAVEQITHIGETKQTKAMVDCAADFLQTLDKRRLNKESITGVPSGYRAIDVITWGWQAKDLIIIAARPSVGKTAFALNLAKRAAFHPGKPTAVGFFSLEMGFEQLTERLISEDSELAMADLRRGNVDDEQYSRLVNQTITKMEKAPIFIDDTAALNLFQFRSKARRLVNKHKVGLIIIDYLQLMSDVQDGKSNSRNREQEISNISRGLKKIAKELNVPIIALSQLSRSAENKTGASRPPMLSDLRESGAIEQDADAVLFIWVPDGEHKPGEIHFRLAKHRNGALEDFRLIRRLHIQKFYDYDDPAVQDQRGAVPGADSFHTPRGGGKKDGGGSFDEGFETKDKF